MREIKFRAWDKKIKAFVVPFDFAINGMGSKFICPNNKLIDHGNFSGDCDQARYEIMQYTGLKDKNGKEIYEGDIVRLASYGKNDPRKIQCVEWNDDRLRFTVNKICDSGREQPYTDADCDVLFGCEIIGNIYENPELLKGEGDK